MKMIMDKPGSWRELLGKIIVVPTEKQRIANALDVNAITLSRWVNGSSTPRPEKVRLLLDALPQQRLILLDLIAEEFPKFSPEFIVADEVPEEVPPACYAQVLSAYADMPASLYFWSVCKLVMQQALEQLDLHRLGMVIMVAQCTPTVGSNKVRSLRGNVRLGTLPQSNSLEQEPVFVGAESLSGRVVSSCQPATVQDFAKEDSYKGHLVAGLESGTAYPILRRGYIAGCFTVTSTQPNFFTPLRLALIQRYANLMALAFEPEEFYDPRRIELGVMPPNSIQRPYFAKFRQRVADVMNTFLNNHRPVNSIEAERLVWQQLEEELLQLSVHSLEE
ncbi:MAG: hypothetical protein NVS4B7_13020 [Ktedonobacteraceae bacterium]